MGTTITFKLRENQKTLASSSEGREKIKSDLEEKFGLPPEIVDDVFKYNKTIDELDECRKNLESERRYLNSDMETSKSNITSKYESQARETRNLFGESFVTDFHSKMEREIIEEEVRIRSQCTPKINELQRRISLLNSRIYSGDINQLGEKQYTLRNPVSVPITKRVKDFFLDFEYYEDTPDYSD